MDWTHGGGKAGPKRYGKQKGTYGCDLARQPVPFAIEERPVFVRFQHVLKRGPPEGKIVRENRSVDFVVVGVGCST